MVRAASRLERISVIVPRNPFTHIEAENHCLCALHVDRIMEWWPGTPHAPHRDPEKVRAIQRSLDWKRVVHIAAYLLQREIHGAPELINKYFRAIYQPRKLEPGREWPPRVGKKVSYEPSEFPSFSNILVHINGARLKRTDSEDSGLLTFDPLDKDLKFTVIDGQHRINGGFLALMIRREQEPNAEWRIPAEVFLDLDKPGDPPRIQAQIFIDVNFYQKKVDRSLVADLFPTTRAGRDPVNVRERAQDIGRRLMLEVGPLVGMIQIPGVRYGVKNVVALATLVGAIEDVIPDLDRVGVTNINSQTEFLAQVLSSWLSASSWRTNMPEEGQTSVAVDPQNVVYQGRVLVSVLALSTAALSVLARNDIPFISARAEKFLQNWFRGLIRKAGFIRNGRFMNRDEFKRKGFLGSGGIAKFRNRLWAATRGSVARLKDESVAARAEVARDQMLRTLAQVKKSS